MCIVLTDIYQMSKQSHTIATLASINFYVHYPCSSANAISSDGYSCWSALVGLSPFHVPLPSLFSLSMFL